MPQGSTQTLSSGPAALRDDDRTGSVYVHGRGTVATYMFEVCLGAEPGL